MKKILLFSLMLVATSAIFGQYNTWTPASGSDGLWGTTANWSNGYPSASDTILFNVPDAMSCTLNTNETIAALRQGSGGPGGILKMESGTELTITENSAIGYDSLSTAELIIENGAIIKQGGSGDRFIRIGDQAGSVGTVTMNGGEIKAASTDANTSIDVGRNGTGTFIMNAGTITVTDDVYVGRGGTGLGNLTVNGGSIILKNEVKDPEIGDLKVGPGTLTLNDGIIDIADRLYLEPTDAMVVLNGGEMIIRDRIDRINSGYIDIAGGTLKLVGDYITGGEASNYTNFNAFIADGLIKGYHGWTELVIEYKADEDMTYITAVAPPVSVEKTNASAFKAYPNPASDYVNIDFGNFSMANCRVSLYDMTGKALINVLADTRNFQLDTKNVKAGMYLLKVVSGQQSQVSKLQIK